MPLRALVAATAIAVSASAAGQACTPREFAQYQDQAKASLAGLADGYCRAHYAGVQVAAARDQSCFTQMAKMSDAAAARGQRVAFEKLTAANDFCKLANASTPTTTKCRGRDGAAYFTNVGCEAGDTALSTLP